MPQISQELADLIVDRTRAIMHNWSPNSQRADYICEFCNVSPRTQNDDIHHKDDCDGKKILEALESADK